MSFWGHQFVNVRVIVFLPIPCREPDLAESQARAPHPRVLDEDFESAHDKTINAA